MQAISRGAAARKARGALDKSATAVQARFRGYRARVVQVASKVGPPASPPSVVGLLLLLALLMPIIAVKMIDA